MSTKEELQSILTMEGATEAQKKAAQTELDALTNPAPAPAPAASAGRNAKGSMWWIPEPTPEEHIAYRALAAAVRADIDARLAKAEAAAKSGASVAPQDVKTCLLATVNDATVPQSEVLAAKIELAQLEIDEFTAASARRTD